MEDTWKWSLVAAVAPILWGANYLVTRALLPAGSPLWGAALRALPAAVLLLALARRLPRGAWWWRAGVLGVCNVGAFFVLIYVAAQHLPSSVAATIMACSPLAMVLLAWAGLGERPAARTVAGGFLGVGGVALLVSAGGHVDPIGVVASMTAMIMSAAGFVLTKRWASDLPPLVITAWQLAVGALMLTIAALAVEGPPPAYDVRGLAGIAYTSMAATVVAYLAWFAALRRLPAGTIGLVGLLNPLTGVLLGVLVGGERLTGAQVVGVAIVIGGIGLGQRVRRRAGSDLQPDLEPDTVAGSTVRAHIQEVAPCPGPRTAPSYSTGQPVSTSVWGSSSTESHRACSTPSSPSPIVTDACATSSGTCGCGTR